MHITQDKVKHMQSVANKCYEIAKERYQKEESFAQKMWLIGYCHDVGYEFTEDSKEHPVVANQLIHDAFLGSCKAILNHGKKLPQTELELRILNEADLKVDTKGNVVTVESRIKDIKIRYGEVSQEYVAAVWLAKELELITSIEEE